MGTLKFGFPERTFYDTKEDQKTQAFSGEIDIDISVEPSFDLPTLGQVKWL